MTTPSAAALTEQIAELLYEHMARIEKSGYIHGCKCGWSARPDLSYRAHVAAEITARLAGLAVTDEAVEAACEAMGPSRNCECTLDSDTCDPCVMTAVAALTAAAAHMGNGLATGRPNADD